MGWRFESEDPSTIEQAKNGWAEIFYNSVLQAWQYKTHTGTEKTFAVGATLEQVRDMLSNAIKDTSTIEWTFDDAQDEIRAAIPPALVATINGALQNGANVSQLTNDSGYQTSAQVQTTVNVHGNKLNNPHSVTKTQVGLSNVQNIDSIPRSSHTGTQLAATISDFDNAIANYFDRFSLQNLN